MMRLRTAWLLGLLIVSSLSAVGAQNGPLPEWGPPFSLDKEKAYTCVRATGPISLDGRLNEDSWARAQLITGFILPPQMDWIAFRMKETRPANSRAVARMMWDDDYLYFAAEVYDQDIYVTHEGHDEAFGQDDIVELFIKPKPDLPYYWELHMMPNGATRDYFYARRSAGGDNRWMLYESGMKVAATMVGTPNHWEDRDQMWTVEMAVPWSAFNRMGGRPQAGDYWRFLVSRYDFSVYLEDGVELSAAAPLPWAAYHLYEHYPHMVFRR